MPFNYPTSAEVRAIEPELVRRNASGRVGLQLMPIRGVNAAKVRWTQRDNFGGLQKLRGMDGQPTRISRVGEKTYEYEPGVFGEFHDITETELTNRAGSVDVTSTPIDVSDLILEGDEILIGREMDRIESSIWAVLTTGTISIKIAGPNGTQVGWTETFAIQTYTAGVTWATYATATPLRNFQAVAQLAIGRSVNLGAGARAYMNSVTSNHMLNNANAADLSGRRTSGGGTFNSLAEVNSYLVANEAPQVVVLDDGYLDESAVFQKFIPDNVVTVIGQRTNGDRIGEYVKTRNASAGYRPESYRYVIDRANGTNGEKRTPANIEVHRGHNGGPVIYYPGAIVKMNV